MLFRKIGLGWKIGTGFAVVLCFVLLVGAVGSLGMTRIKQAVNMATEAGELNRLIELARVHARTYMTSGDKTHVAQCDATLQQVFGELETMRATAGAEEAELFDTALTHVRDYDRLFEEYVAEDKLRAEMDWQMVLSARATVKEAKLLQSRLEQRALEYAGGPDGPVTASQAGQATEILVEHLQARRHEKNYIIREKQEYLDRVAKLVASTQKRCVSLERRLPEADLEALARTVREQTEVYWVNYQAVVQSMRKLSRMDAEMNQLALAAERALEGVVLSKARTTQKTQSLAMSAIIVGFIAAVLLGSLIAVLIVRCVTKGIGAAMDCLSAVSRGDLRAEPDQAMLDRGDQVGDLMRMLRHTITAQRRKEELAEAIAEGDLTHDMEPASESDQLGKALQRMTEGLRSILGTVQAAALRIASGARQVSDSSGALSQGATEQAGSLEEISSSMMEINSQTKNNADNAALASDVVIQARDKAREGADHMGRMTEAMEEIEESSQSIGRIIKVIDEIAFQTNLLALNAAVEAARAGKHGQGFAVVADEVRNLAGRSAKAAQETAQLIEGSVSRVRIGSEIAGQTAEALEGIVTDVGRAAELVAEIAAASGEQAEGVAQVNLGLQQVEQVTHQNTVSSEQTAEAASHLSNQAADLHGLLDGFRLEEQSSNHDSPMYALPSPASPPRKADPGAADNNRKNTSISGVQARPEEIISLDEGDFGRY
ncbi:methyl-accepting chemotaxis protein [Paucidesulfovibrio gracilis]|nr:methyl-accepting chemotaxis protein [Paucidesulfovibrio gracilis]